MGSNELRLTPTELSELIKSPTNPEIDAALQEALRDTLGKFSNETKDFQDGFVSALFTFHMMLSSTREVFTESGLLVYLSTLTAFAREVEEGEGK